MFHALDMGVSVESFWDMSPRAVVLLHREMRRAAGKSAPARRPAEPQLVRLNYIPRP